MNSATANLSTEFITIGEHFVRLSLPREAPWCGKLHQPLILSSRRLEEPATMPLSSITATSPQTALARPPRVAPSHRQASLRATKARGTRLATSSSLSHQTPPLNTTASVSFSIARRPTSLSCPHPYHHVRQITLGPVVS
jgi:hypothetical protein